MGTALAILDDDRGLGGILWNSLGVLCSVFRRALITYNLYMNLHDY